MSKFVNRFVISDHHFGHTNSWEKFKLADGSPLRPFTSDDEMNEAMIERHNAKVKQHDTVYFLGDVVINRKHLQLVKRLNGRKILIRGNHDIFRDEDYREVGFEQIHGVRVFVDKFILSHIPLHPDCVTGRFRVNVHGHLHANQIMRNMKVKAPIYNSNGVGVGIMDVERPEPDPRYISACVELNDYTPQHFDEMEAKIQKRFEQYRYTPPAGYFNGSGPS